MDVIDAQIAVEDAQVRLRLARDGLQAAVIERTEDEQVQGKYQYQGKVLIIPDDWQSYNISELGSRLEILDADPVVNLDQVALTTR